MRLFTLERCPPCEMVKKYLKTAGKEVDQLHFTRDPSGRTAEHDEALKKYKFRSFPTLVTDEGEVISGGQKIIQYFRTGGRFY